LIPDVWRDGATLVPIPPSKLDSGPEYDDRRLLAILNAVRPKLPGIRPLVVLDEDAAVASKKGLQPTERAEHYPIDAAYADPEPDVIVLFDDVLTTGCHFQSDRERPE
jgi:hypothetical protein